LFSYNVEKNDQPTAVRQRNANRIGVCACPKALPKKQALNPAHEVKLAW